MNTRLAVPAEPDEVVYPCADGQPMADNPIHVWTLVTLLGTLRRHYEASPDVYVIGNSFWYYEEGNPLARRAPDAMVVKGVPKDKPRESFKSWEEDAFPCWILEVASASTTREDRREKRELYGRLGVREYFLFDGTGELQVPPLIGLRLSGQAYVELPADADGFVTSAELGMRLRAEGEDVALYDARTGERILSPGQDADHQKQRAEEAQRRAEEERKRAEQEWQRAERAEQERQRSEEESRRRDGEKDAEIARLRALLQQQTPPSAG
jgi:Uma2 family endonuclease